MLLHPVSAFANDTVSNDTGTRPALLPQNQPWQVDLYAWLSTLTPDADSTTGVALTLQALSWNNDYINEDDLYRQFASLVPTRLADGTEDLGILRKGANHFVLNTDNANELGDGIEGSGAVQWVSGVGPATFWYNYDVPGNIHFQSPALARRIMAMVAVDMMMGQQEFETNNSFKRSFYLGGMMNMWVMAYGHLKDNLSAEVQAAFEAGFADMVSFLESWDGGFADEGKEGDLDTKTIAALARLYGQTTNADLQGRILTLVKNYLFGGVNGNATTIIDFSKAIFNPGGFIKQLDGPATTYDGVARYYLLEAVSAVYEDQEWAFLWDTDGVVDRMLAWKSYQHLGDPDDFYDGPSAYSARTANSHVYDQQGDRTWRDTYAALLYNSGRYLGQSYRSGNPYGFPTAAEMQDAMQTRINNVNANGFASPDTLAGAEWVLDSWPRQYPYFYDAYDFIGKGNGYVSAHRNFVNQQSDLIKPYFDKAGDFDVNIGEADVMWASKGNDGSQDFGFLVETFPIAGGWGGLKGGSLQAFWTEDTGIVFLGKSRGRLSAGATIQDSYTNLHWAAAHHAWGYFENGDVFSTATEEIPTGSTYNLGGEQPSVVFESQIWAQKLGVQDLTNPIAYSRVFTKVADGLQITTSFTPDANAQGYQVGELWESLPVFLRDGNDQATLNDATIEYGDGIGWLALPDSLVETSVLRIGRDFGSGPSFVYVRFEKPERVRLNAQVWTTNYQTDNRIRSIDIDLHGETGVAIGFPEVAITYTIGTELPLQNAAPEVTILTPGNGSNFDEGTSIDLEATTTDSDGTVTSVQYYANGALLGEGTGTNFSYTWSNVAAGSYVVTAVATDDQGASTTSSAVQMTVTDPAATSFKLVASEDTYARGGGYKVMNFSTEDSLFVKRGSSGSERTLAFLKFDLSSIPDSITNAVVTLYPYEVAGAPTHSIEETTEAWNASTLNWNNRPKAGALITTWAPAVNTPVLLDLTEQAQAAWLASAQSLELRVGSISTGDTEWAIYGTSESDSEVHQPVIEITTTGGDVAPPPPANNPPQISMTQPLDGSTHALGSVIDLAAEATDSDGAIASVDYYANGDMIGAGDGENYAFSWSNDMEGTYQLTAVATDDQGASTTSSAIEVVIESQTAFTLVASEDVYVRGGSFKTTNFNGQDSMLVQRGGPPSERAISYLKFDLSAIPDTITSAILSLYPYEVTGSPQHDIAETTDDWTDATMIWLNRSKAGPLLGSWIPEAGVPVVLDLTQQAQAAWLNGNQSLELRISASVTSNTDLAIYRTEESDMISERPVLDVSTAAGTSGEGNLHKQALTLNAEIPASFTLDGNYPNPFNPTTTLLINLPEDADIQIDVYDMMGRNVLSLPSRQVSAGQGRTLQLDASPLASGTYFYRVLATLPNSRDVQTGKMILLK